MTNLNQVFQTLLNDTFIRYKGCLIEKCANGYRWNNKPFDTLGAAQQHIDTAANNIKNSLKIVA